MVNKTLVLSVLGLLVSFINLPKADSFLLPVKSSVCIDVTNETSKADSRFKAYDKAVFVAVKSSSYMKQRANTLEDYDYDELAYKLADKALNEISLITIRDDEEKICLELSGMLDTAKAEKISQQQNKEYLQPQDVRQIANEINHLLPKSLTKTEEKAIPLMYVKDIEYFNNTTSSAYKAKITEQLSFEPRVLVTENIELADYYFVPKLVLSKSEKIDDENSRFSMVLVVEIQKTNGVIVDSREEKRYIMINNSQNMQEIAQKLLMKLLEDAINAMSRQLNNLD